MPTVYRIVLLALVALLPAVAAAQTPKRVAPSLGDVLDARGALAPGATGAFDATGYRLANAPDGAPRFVEASPAGAFAARFGQPGVQGYRILAAAVAANGDLYVGGSFRDAGGLRVNNIARWDGTRWYPLGDGVDGAVTTIAIDGDVVYAGGDFNRAGAAEAPRLARWDGAAWSAIPGTLADSYGGRGTVSALAVLDGDLYVGGHFAEAGGQTAHSLARWDGTAWSPVGEGIYNGIWSPTSYGGGYVYALAAHDGALYVGGKITHGGPVAAPTVLNGVGRFDPAAGTWSALGDGLSESTYSVGEVQSFAFDGGDVYVGGRFKVAGGVDAKNVARWDGAAWHALGDGTAGAYSGTRVVALAVSDGVLYAGGSFDTAGGFSANRVARWRNGAWTPLVDDAVNGVDGEVGAIVVGARGELFVAGYFDLAGPVHVSEVARWDAAAEAWHALGDGVGSGTYGDISAVAVAPDGDVYVGGSFDHAGSTAAKNIARWDGEAWHPLGPGLDGAVHALVVDGTSVYAGGVFTNSADRSLTHVARWDAAAGTWHPLGSGVNGNVYSLAVGGGYLYAGGSFTAAGTVDANNIARWNGTAWSKLGGGITFSGSAVYAIDVTGSLVVIGGTFTYAATPRTGGESVRVNGLTLWDGATDDWYLLGDGVWDGTYAGYVYALAFVGDDLYVGGDFNKAGTTSAAGIARWNLTEGAWHALGAGVGGTYAEVRTLAAGPDGLYAGGNFATAGGTAANHVARWDGAAWSPLAAGLNDAMEHLAAGGGSVYAVGDFSTADGLPSFRFAEWRTGAAPPPPPPPPPGQARIAVDPLAVAFGSVRSGTSEVLMITIQNEADATAALSGTVGEPAPPFRVTEGGGAFTLAPGESREVLVAFTPTGLGVAAAELPITHDAPNLASPVTVTLRGDGTLQLPGPVVVRGFDPAGPQTLLRTQNGGFVFGTNGYGDRAKGTALTVPPGKTAMEVDEVRVWFGYKSPAVTAETYTLALYDGTAETGPQGDPLYAASYPYAAVAADADAGTAESPTVHRLPRPVAVSGSFFVVVDFGQYAAADLAALTASAPLGRRVAEVWEQDRSGAWSNVSDAWTSGTEGWQLWIEAASEGQTVAREEEALPAAPALHANFPNPFHPRTTIRYALPTAGPVRLAVYDVLGRHVATLVDAPQPAGPHAVTFDGTGLPSGTYVYRLEAAGRTETRWMQLVR